MNPMKRFASLLLTLTLTLSLAACGGTSNGGSASGEDSPGADAAGEPAKKYLIGISQYGEHGSLDNCRTGFLQGLEEAGLKEGTDFEVDYQNAGFDDSIATQIGQTFSAENVDLIDRKSVV